MREPHQALLCTDIRRGASASWLQVYKKTEHVKVFNKITEFLC